MQKIKELITQYKEYRKIYIENLKKENGLNRFKKRIPNILTKSRFIAPFIIVPISLTSFPLALITTGIFALTDAFDGYFARKYNAFSDYGRILDPICDKIFAIGITLPMLITNPLSILTTIILELGISLTNLISAVKGNDPRSTYLGKFKTAILSINLAMNYLNIFNIIPFNIFTNIVQLITLNDYNRIDKNKDKRKKLKNKVKLELNQNITVEDNIKPSQTKQQINELRELRNSFTEAETNQSKTLNFKI